MKKWDSPFFIGTPFTQSEGMIPLWKRWLCPTNPDEVPNEYWDFAGYYRLVSVDKGGITVTDARDNDSVWYC